MKFFFPLFFFLMQSGITVAINLGRGISGSLVNFEIWGKWDVWRNSKEFITLAVRVKGVQPGAMSETQDRNRLINRPYEVRHEQTAKYYCRICRNFRHHTIFFLCPLWNHLPLEEENETDLTDIKYHVKGLKGVEELVSNLGPCESQLQMRNNENWKCQRDSNYGNYRKF